MKNCPSCGSAVAGRIKYCDDCRDTRAPWRINHDNMKTACALLGIDISVRVRRVATRRLLGRYHGVHLTDDAPLDMEVAAKMTEEQLAGFMYHKITIGTRLTPEAASRALWHELTHAKQFQDNPERYVHQYAEELKAARALAASGETSFAEAYRTISFEVEAKANEGLHDTVCSLTHVNKRANMPELNPPHTRITHVVNGKIYLGDRGKIFDKWTKESILAAQEMLAANA